MRASKIGAGNANAEASGANTYHSRRTSYSMVVGHGPVFRARHPRLAAMADALQRRGLALFGAGEGREWGTPGQLPVPGQYAYEGLQVTRYEEGQHFLAHEVRSAGWACVHSLLSRGSSMIKSVIKSGGWG